MKCILVPVGKVSSVTCAAVSQRTGFELVIVCACSTLPRLICGLLCRRLSVTDSRDSNHISVINFCGHSDSNGFRPAPQLTSLIRLVSCRTSNFSDIRIVSSLLRANYSYKFLDTRRRQLRLLVSTNVVCSDRRRFRQSITMLQNSMYCAAR